MDLLNRWIVPLEKRYDYLTMVTGKKLEVPFELLLIFSTNLDPHQLADEAFLRRIKFKIVGLHVAALVPSVRPPVAHVPAA